MSSNVDEGVNSVCNRHVTYIIMYVENIQEYGLALTRHFTLALIQVIRVLRKEQQYWQ